MAALTRDRKISRWNSWIKKDIRRQSSRTSRESRHGGKTISTSMIFVMTFAVHFDGGSVVLKAPTVVTAKVKDRNDVSMFKGNYSVFRNGGFSAGQGSELIRDDKILGNSRRSNGNSGRLRRFKNHSRHIRRGSNRRRGNGGRVDRSTRWRDGRGGNFNG